MATITSAEPKQPTDLFQMQFYVGQLKYQIDFDQYDGSQDSINKITNDDLFCSMALMQLQGSSDPSDNEMADTAITCMNTSQSTRTFQDINMAAHGALPVGYVMNNLSSEETDACDAAFFAFNEAYQYQG